MSALDRALAPSEEHELNPIWSIARDEVRELRRKAKAYDDLVSLVSGGSRDALADYIAEQSKGDGWGRHGGCETLSDRK